MGTTTADTIALDKSTVAALVAGARAWSNAFADQPKIVGDGAAAFWRLNQALAEADRAMNDYAPSGATNLHTPQCWKAHGECAVDAVQRLRAALARIRNDLDRLPTGAQRLSQIANDALDSLL